MLQESPVLHTFRFTYIQPVPKKGKKKGKKGDRLVFLGN